MLARFTSEYQQAQRPAMLEIERKICGCDYGSTSWTTQGEANRVAELLELAPGRRLLDLGAGSGWPGLYLARTSGCDVTLVDIPEDALRIAARRVASDRLLGAVWPVVSDGATLPFGDGTFDAIEHSDVLCCLESKTSVLAECRRTIRFAGRMVFSVISIAPSLSRAAHERAAAAGPPFKAVSSEYPGMLARTGWQVLQRVDLTDAYELAVTQRLHQEEANSGALIEILNEAAFTDMIARRSRTAAAIKDGLLQRELFATRPLS